MTITQKTVDVLYKEQRGGCALCGRLFTRENPMQVHHAVYTRNVNFAKLLDMPQNLALICLQCHTTLHGHLTGWTRRSIFYQDKIAKGYDMRTWNNALKEAGMVTDYFIDTSGETSGGMERGA